MATCRHLICELVEGNAVVTTPDDVVPTCSLEIVRARGCRPGQFAKDIAPALLEEVKTLLGAIDIEDRTEATKTSAARLAQIVRLEALEERNLLAQVRDEDPELAKSLMKLLARR